MALGLSLGMDGYDVLIAGSYLALHAAYSRFIQTPASASTQEDEQSGEKSGIVSGRRCTGGQKKIDEHEAAHVVVDAVCNVKQATALPSIGEGPTPIYPDVSRYMPAETRTIESTDGIETARCAVEGRTALRALSSQHEDQCAPIDQQKSAQVTAVSSRENTVRDYHTGEHELNSLNSWMSVPEKPCKRNSKGPTDSKSVGLCEDLDKKRRDWETKAIAKRIRSGSSYQNDQIVQKMSVARRKRQDLANRPRSGERKVLGVKGGGEGGREEDSEDDDNDESSTEYEFRVSMVIRFDRNTKCPRWCP
ncbi:MAG: hypothetical protein Q9164_001565 [Protoblastenia rupestris]